MCSLILRHLPPNKQVLLILFSPFFIFLSLRHSTFSSRPSPPLPLSSPLPYHAQYFIFILHNYQVLSYFPPAIMFLIFSFSSTSNSITSAFFFYDLYTIIEHFSLTLPNTFFIQPSPAPSMILCLFYHSDHLPGANPGGGGGGAKKAMVSPKFPSL